MARLIVPLLLGRLSEALTHDEEALNEITRIKSNCDCCQTLTGVVDCICCTVRIALTVPPIDQLSALVVRLPELIHRCNRSWTIESIADAVDMWLDAQQTDVVVSGLIQANTLISLGDTASGRHWAEVVQRHLVGSENSVAAAWAQTLLAHSYYVEGECHTKRYEFKQAVRCLEQGQAIRPSYVCYVTLGAVFTAMNDHITALSHYEKALELAPGHPIVLAIVACLHCRLGHLDKAQRIVDGVQPNDIDNSLREAAQARIHSANGLSHLAIASYQQAIAHAIDEECIPDYWFNLGREFQILGLWDSAIKAYREAAAMDHGRALVHLTYIDYTHGRVPQAVKQLNSLLQEARTCIVRCPYKALYPFSIWDSDMLYNYEFVSAVDLRVFPGSGMHLVDGYLAAAQGVLLDCLRTGEIDQSKSLGDLHHIGMLWCLYGQMLRRKGLSQQFAREQLYTIKHETDQLIAAVRDANGFASMMDELVIRIGTTGDEEFAHEMLRLEGPWLRSAGDAQERGLVQDLRSRLKGNLWVHAFEWRSTGLGTHLERIHYYMELLKGHTLLHKFTDPMKTTANRGKAAWARCLESLPVRLDRQVIVDTDTCARDLPKTSMAISYYFLHRQLLPNLMIVVLLEPDKEPRLRIIDTAKRLYTYQNAAIQMKNVHDRVAWRPKTEEVGKDFSQLAGLKSAPKGRSLTEAVVQWEKEWLNEAYRAVVEDMIDLQEIQGKDLYISPAPEMYDIPFGLLYTGEDYLNNVARSVTVTPIFSLRRTTFEASLAQRENLVLCLDDHWENDAALRRRSLSSDNNRLPDLCIESCLPEGKDDSRSKYDEWIYLTGGRHGAHIIGHHDARQWSRPLESKPNLGQFGGYLYAAPNRLTVELLGLEACWGGTWADPEDLMGLFVSFLASGVNAMIASPYSLVPSQTSGRLFSRIYQSAQATGRIDPLQLARSIRDAAAEVSAGDDGIEDTIPTLWGSLQLYAAT